MMAGRIDSHPADHPPVSVALNYLFVELSARGRGLARLLRDVVGELANAAVEAAASAPPPALFIEQNDPLLLSDADYAADNAHAGITE